MLKQPSPPTCPAPQRDAGSPLSSGDADTVGNYRTVVARCFSTNLNAVAARTAAEMRLFDMFPSQRLEPAHVCARPGSSGSIGGLNSLRMAALYVGENPSPMLAGACCKVLRTRAALC